MNQQSLRNVAAGLVGFVLGGVAGAGLALVGAPDPALDDLREVAGELLPEGVSVAESGVAQPEGLGVGMGTAEGILTDALDLGENDGSNALVDWLRARADDAGWDEVTLVRDPERGLYVTGTRGTEVFELEAQRLLLLHRLAPLLIPSAVLGAVTGAVGLAALVVLGRRPAPADSPVRP